MCKGVGLTPFPFSEEQQTIDQVSNWWNIDKHCSESPRKLQSCRVDILGHRIGHSDDSATLHVPCLQKLLTLHSGTNLIGRPDDSAPPVLQISFVYKSCWLSCIYRISHQFNSLFLSFRFVNL